MQDYNTKFVIELISKMKRKPEKYSIEQDKHIIILRDNISYRIEFEKVSDASKFMKFLKYELIPERRDSISLTLVNFLIETKPKVSVIPP
jgi:hypothetical protein